MCPPVLVRALYAIWADTQVRPYTNHINTKSSAIRRCNTNIYRDARSVSSERVSLHRIACLAVLLLLHVENKKSPRGKFEFSTWRCQRYLSKAMTLGYKSPQLSTRSHYNREPLVKLLVYSVSSGKWCLFLASLWRVTCHLNGAVHSFC